MVALLMPDLIAIVLLVITLFLFLWIGIKATRRIKGEGDFLFAGRKLKGSPFQHTLVAGATSLAAVLSYKNEARD